MAEARILFFIQFRLPKSQKKKREPSSVASY